MRLRTIEVGGFKSFAKHTTVVVDPGLTAIIGPNGSGKSNLAEAVRWVLGEQSLKQLRSESRSDILFAGTGDLKRAGRALVKLTFENEDGKFPIEAAEVSIARSLTSDGESEYSVNGEAVRLADLRRMLAEAGIGARTYTVISQGMVDRYLTASASERRMFFNEAAGIQGLILRLTETQRHLSQAETRTAELVAILRELSPRLRLLQREMQKQEERTRLEAEYKAAQATWFHQAWHERGQELARLRDKVAILESQVSEARSARESAEAALLESATLPEIPTSWNGRVRRVLKESLVLIDALLNNHSIPEERLKGLRSEITHLLSPTPGNSPTRNPGALSQTREAELVAERSLAAARIGLEQAEAALSLLRQEVVRERGSVFLREIETTAPRGDVGFSEEEIMRLGNALARLGEVDPLALREYEQTRERHRALDTHIQDSEQTTETLYRTSAKLEMMIQERFEKQFAILQRSFAHHFTQLFGGGQAKLVIGEDGIEIMATPPGKPARHVGLLSGGERTLTSLALLLAIVEAQSPPFVVLDEVDAALDEANSERFAALLKEKSQGIQCLVVTHNRATMGQADRLYGVTMQQAGVSSLYSVTFEDLKE